MPTITEPGVYTMDAEAYHADPCVTPSLSSSIAKTLLDRSPRHAWRRHPRLNQHYRPVRSTVFDRGTAAHSLLLEGHADNVVVIRADDFRTKAAQLARDAAQGAGKIPMLSHQFRDVQAMVDAAKAQLREHPEGAAFLNPEAPRESTLVWKEGETWCRARTDCMTRLCIWDYKTTAAAATVDGWGSGAAYETGCDIQAAFYLRGVRALRLSDSPKFRFVVQEADEPFALSIFELTPHALSIADARVSEALQLWQWCLSRNRWPGYINRVNFIDPPVWYEKRWQTRSIGRAMLADQGVDPNGSLLQWVAA